jgi:hypothetical protein
VGRGFGTRRRDRTHADPPPGIAIKAIDPTRFLPIAEVLPTMPAVTAGCPYGLPGVDPRKPLPIALDGIVAGTDPDSQTLFLSTPTFPGNSGGPIFISRSPMSAEGVLTVGRPTLFLAGIVIGVQSVAPHDVHESPLRLGVGVGADVLRHLLEGAEAERMREVIKRPA